MFDYLAAKEYPGRGIILGKSEDNRAVFAYFIMGRSTNSRNRVFEVSNDDIMTKGPFTYNILTCTCSWK